MPIVKHTSRIRKRQKKLADTRRGSARERGYTTAWDKFSKSFLIENPLCLYCKTSGRVSASVLVDHIVPHRGNIQAFWPRDGQDWSKFFAASCDSCHNGPKQRAENYAEKTGQDVRRVLVVRKMLPQGFFDEP